MNRFEHADHSIISAIWKDAEFKMMRTHNEIKLFIETAEGRWAIFDDGNVGFHTGGPDLFEEFQKQYENCVYCCSYNAIQLLDEIIVDAKDIEMPIKQINDLQTLREEIAYCSFDISPEEKKAIAWADKRMKKYGFTTAALKFKESDFHFEIIRADSPRRLDPDEYHFWLEHQVHNLISTLNQLAKEQNSKITFAPVYCIDDGERYLSAISMSW